MTITATKSWKNYITLCSSLKRNEIPYQCDDKRLCVRCRVNGRDFDQSFLFSIDPSKMLVTLFCAIPVFISAEKTADIALGTAIINNNIPDGCFCMDIGGGLLYFRMTASFYESDICGTVFEYMLSSAADAIDEYYPGLKKLAAETQISSARENRINNAV